MENTLIALAIPSLLLVPAMGLASRLKCRRAIGNELKRKALHICTGLAALSFPIFLTSPWLICTALGVVVVWMIAVRLLPSLRLGIGACLHDTQRISYGEIYFTLSVAALLLMTGGRPLLYVIPLLILTLADAAAAIIGRLGSERPLREFANGKTLRGCLAFAVVAFLITQIMLATFTDLGLLHTIGAALVMAITSCIAELVARRGLDNVLIPAVSYTTLLLLDIPGTQFFLQEYFHV